MRERLYGASATKDFQLPASLQVMHPTIASTDSLHETFKRLMDAASIYNDRALKGKIECPTEIACIIRELKAWNGKDLKELKAIVAHADKQCNFIQCYRDKTGAQAQAVHKFKAFWDLAHAIGDTSSHIELRSKENTITRTVFNGFLMVVIALISFAITAPQLEQLAASKATAQHAQHVQEQGSRLQPLRPPAGSAGVVPILHHGRVTHITDAGGLPRVIDSSVGELTADYLKDMQPYIDNLEEQVTFAAGTALHIAELSDKDKCFSVTVRDLTPEEKDKIYNDSLRVIQKASLGAVTSMNRDDFLHNLQQKVLAVSEADKSACTTFNLEGSEMNALLNKYYPNLYNLFQARHELVNAVNEKLLYEAQRQLFLNLWTFGVQTPDESAATVATTAATTVATTALAAVTGRSRVATGAAALLPTTWQVARNFVVPQLQKVPQLQQAPQVQEPVGAAWGVD